MWVRIPHTPQILNEMAKRRMFEVLDELNKEDSINDTRAVEVGIDFLRAKKVKAGAEIVMGMPESSLHDIASGDKILLLLLVDKQEYFKRIGE